MKKGQILSWLTRNRSALQRLTDRLFEDGASIYEVKQFLTDWIEDQIPILLEGADKAADAVIDWEKILPGELGALIERHDNHMISDLVELIISAANDTNSRRARLRGMTLSRIKARRPAIVARTIRRAIVGPGKPK